MAEKEIVNKKGFTLAETMVVLIVLGIVAAITIPPLVRRQIEAANRAKIKKSMTVYDWVMNQMTVENNLKSDAEVISFAGDENNNCKGSTKYFKKVQGDGCRFMTSDKVWWDISDILNPTIALNEDDLDNPDAATTFKLKAWFDNVGLRVDDLVAVSDENKPQLQKLYDYLSGKKITSTTSTTSTSPTTIRPRTYCDGYECYQYDEYGRKIGYGEECSGDTLSSCDDKQIFDYTDGEVTIGSSCSGTTIETCPGKTYYPYDPQTAGWDTGSLCDIRIKRCQIYYSYENGITTGYSNCLNRDRSKCAYYNEVLHETYDPSSPWYKQTGVSCDAQGKNCQIYYTYNNGIMTVYKNCPGDTVDSCTSSNVRNYFAYDEDTGLEIGSCSGPTIDTCSMDYNTHYDDEY